MQQSFIIAFLVLVCALVLLVLRDAAVNTLSKSFTFYKNKSAVTKNISLKHLRKTYITWVNQVMDNETGKLTSHSIGKVLEEFYLDSTILSVVQKEMLNI